MPVHIIPYRPSLPSDGPRAGLRLRGVYMDLAPCVGLVQGLRPFATATSAPLRSGSDEIIIIACRSALRPDLRKNEDHGSIVF